MEEFFAGQMNLLRFHDDGGGFVGDHFRSIPYLRLEPLNFVGFVFINNDDRLFYVSGFLAFMLNDLELFSGRFVSLNFSRNYYFCWNSIYRRCQSNKVSFTFDIATSVTIVPCSKLIIALPTRRADFP